MSLVVPMRYKIIKRIDIYCLLKNDSSYGARVSMWYTLPELLFAFQHVKDPLLIKEYRKWNNDIEFAEADTVQDLILQFPWAVL